MEQVGVSSKRRDQKDSMTIDAAKELSRRIALARRASDVPSINQDKAPKPSIIKSGRSVLMVQGE